MQKEAKPPQPDENQHAAGAASAPRPAKRKFQAPGFSGSMPLKAAIQNRSFGSVFVASSPKAVTAPGSATTAQYYTVLYTKRAANKVGISVN